MRNKKKNLSASDWLVITIVDCGYFHANESKERVVNISQFLKLESEAT